MPKATDLLKYLIRIDESKVYSNSGPLAEEFSGSFSSRFGLDSPHSTTCANATLALSGLLATSGMREFESIQVPSWTFAATPLAIATAHFDVDFVDVNEIDWSSEIPKGGLPGIHVLPFGAPYVGSVTASNSANLPLIIDAAASFGSIDSFEMPTDRPWAVVFSTHATKVLGSGEGGVVVSSDPEWIIRLKAWMNFGFWGSRNSGVLGLNAKMSEYHAAVGLASLEMWPETEHELRVLGAQCRTASDELGLSVHPALRDGYCSSYWVIQSKSAHEKSHIVKALAADQIEYRDWWSSGAHRMPAFADARQLDTLETTDYLAATTIGLPFFIGMSMQQINRICSAIEDGLELAHRK